MKSAAGFSILFTTSPTTAHARKLSQKLLRQKLCACIQLIPKMESHYWWKNKITKSAEVLMLIKTKRSKVTQIEKLILKHHPYDVPEIVETSILSVSKAYLSWLEGSLL